MQLLTYLIAVVCRCSSSASHLDGVTSFIDGSSLAAPTSRQKVTRTFLMDPHKIQKRLYYLLADFYLKNSELKKAVKFYQLDLVINALRVDSWAGLALAKKSQIEQELNAVSIFHCGAYIWNYLLRPVIHTDEAMVPMLLFIFLKISQVLKLNDINLFFL